MRKRKAVPSFIDKTPAQRVAIERAQARYKVQRKEFLCPFCKLECSAIADSTKSPSVVVTHPEPKCQGVLKLNVARYMEAARESQAKIAGIDTSKELPDPASVYKQ